MLLLNISTVLVLAVACYAAGLATPTLLKRIKTGRK
jgi:hypothetical protein